MHWEPNGNPMVINYNGSEKSNWEINGTQWSFILDLPFENGDFFFYGYLSLTEDLFIHDEDLFIHELEEMEIMWDRFFLGYKWIG